MSDESAQRRIELLLARGQAQRLAIQLALFDAREQLAPLRTAASLIGTVGAVFTGSTAPLLGALGRFGHGHPWLTTATVGAASRWLFARPRWLLAGAVVLGAWWLVRPPVGAARREGEPAP